MIEPSWEVFEECEKCLAPESKPCYKLNSTSKQLVECLNPHPGRKQKKK